MKMKKFNISRKIMPFVMILGLVGGVLSTVIYPVEVSAKQIDKVEVQNGNNADIKEGEFSATSDGAGSSEVGNASANFESQASGDFDGKASGDWEVVENAEKSPNTGLYIGIGSVVIIAMVATTLTINKKRKQKKGMALYEDI